MLSLRLLFYSLTILILGLAVALRISWQEKDQILPKNQPAKLIATLKKEPRIYDGQQVLEVGDGRVYVDLYPRYKVGDRLKIEGEVDSEGRISGAKVERISVGNNFMSQLRLRIWEKISQLLPSREATLVSGTVLGVDTIEKEFRDQLIKTGTIHVVVVSGQNLMIVAGVFLSLVRYFGRRKSLALACLAVITYAFLTGFEAPVVRASIMVILASIAIYFGRQMMPIWSLILAALLILFIWPQAIFEVSFQLTFAATLGIMTRGSWLTRILAGPVSSFLPAPSINSGQAVLRVYPERSRRAVGNPPTAVTRLIKGFIADNAAMATSAYIFTAPIILFYFGRFWTFATFANLLVAAAG